jgi:hypothetical protein
MKLHSKGKLKLLATLAITERRIHCGYKHSYRCGYVPRCG